MFESVDYIQFKFFIDEFTDQVIVEFDISFDILKMCDLIYHLLEPGILFFHVDLKLTILGFTKWVCHYTECFTEVRMCFKFLLKSKQMLILNLDIILKLLFLGLTPLVWVAGLPTLWCSLSDDILLLLGLFGLTRHVLG